MSHNPRSRMHDLLRIARQGKIAWDSFLNTVISVWLVALGSVMLSVESMVVGLLCWAIFLAAAMNSPDHLKGLNGMRRGTPLERELADLVTTEVFPLRTLGESSVFVLSFIFFTVGFAHAMGMFAVGHHLPHWLP
ncbi:MAG: hypothetical protein H0X38_02075 [Planctomycetes bacterium]|nr:hypothetical protein [Planctomycetota bacterium]